MAYQDKVNEAVAAMAQEAYRQANTTKAGTRRKRHVPYALPELANAMVKALNTDDEAEAKRLLLLYRTGALSLV